MKKLSKVNLKLPIDFALKLITKKTLYVVFIFSPIFLNAQINTDSLKKILANKLADSTRLKINLQLAKELVYSNVTEAKQYANNSIQLATNLSNISAMAGAHKLLGVVYDVENKPKESINQYLKAVSYYNKLQDSLSVAKCEVNIGMLYLNAKVSNKAFPYFKRSEAVFRKNNFYLGIQVAIQNEGICFYNVANYDSALVYFDKALKISEQNNLEDEGALTNIGNCYFNLKQYDKAEEYYNKFLKIKEENQEFDERYYHCKLGLSDVLDIKYKNNIACLEDVKKGYERLNLRDASDYLKCLWELALAYKKHNRINEGFDLLLYSTLMKDSLVLEQNEAKMLELNEQYQSDKKDLELTNINKEKQLLIVEQKLKQNFIYGLIGGTVILIIFLVVTYNLLKNKKRDNLIINNQKATLEIRNKEKDALIQEIHHRVKNNLQVINAILRMQLNNMPADERKGYLSETSRRIGSMSLVHEMLYNKDNESEIDIKQYLQELIKNIEDLSNNSNNKIEFVADIEQLFFDVSKAISIGMITSELLSNSLKYAFEKTEFPVIKIALKHKDQNTVILYYSDNGVGLPDSINKKNGLGMRLIDIFSRQIKGNYNFENNEGLTFKLEFLIKS